MLRLTHFLIPALYPKHPQEKGVGKTVAIMKYLQAGALHCVILFRFVSLCHKLTQEKDR